MTLQPCARHCHVAWLVLLSKPAQSTGKRAVSTQLSLSGLKTPSKAHQWSYHIICFKCWWLHKVQCHEQGTEPGGYQLHWWYPYSQPLPQAAPNAASHSWQQPLPGFCCACHPVPCTAHSRREQPAPLTYHHFSRPEATSHSAQGLQVQQETQQGSSKHCVRLNRYCYTGRPRLWGQRRVHAPDWTDTDGSAGAHSGCDQVWESEAELGSSSVVYRATLYPGAIAVVISVLLWLAQGCDPAH